MTRRWIAASVAVVIAAATLGWFVVTRDSGTESDESDDLELTTATIQRRDLVETETFDGSLGYDDDRTLMSARTGTLTWIADEGAILRRGDVLYEVDERPVVLMFGAVPAYRALSSGVEGPDVRQLQRNLLAMGFDDGGDLEVTGEFDADTAEAVSDWQEDLGLDRTGTVELGDFVFEPGARRMGAHNLQVGSMVGGAQVAATTSTERVVTLDLDASDQDLVARGDGVHVVLPGGERVAGRVTDVSKVAKADPEDPEAEPTVEVSVHLLRQVKTDLDEAPVDVDVETSRAENVLTVPVEGLLVLAEGGYALEVVDGPGRTYLIGVETGTFADGFVEVVSGEIAEGLEVVTAE